MKTSSRIQRYLRHFNAKGYKLYVFFCYIPQYGYVQVLEKARAELELYNQLLSGKEYIFQNRYVSSCTLRWLTLTGFDRLSSIDVIIAAHIIFLVDPPYPGPLIKDLVSNSYPALVSYAQQIYSQAFKAGLPPIQITSPSSSLWALIPSWPKTPVHLLKPKSQEDIYYNRMSLGFVGLSIGSLAAYIAVVGSQVRKRYLEEVESETTDRDSHN